MKRMCSFPPKHRVFALKKGKQYIKGDPITQKTFFLIMPYKKKMNSNSWLNLVSILVSSKLYLPWNLKTRRDSIFNIEVGKSWWELLLSNHLYLHRISITQQWTPSPRQILKYFKPTWFQQVHELQHLWAKIPPIKGNMRQGDEQQSGKIKSWEAGGYLRTIVSNIGWGVF